MKAFESGMPVSDMLHAAAAATPKDGIRLGELLARLGGEGRLAAVMLLTAPFLLPVSLPGMSTPFGILILFLCYSLLSDRRLQLPKLWSAARVRQKHMALIASRSAPILRRMEGWCKPRVVWCVLCHIKLLSMSLDLSRGFPVYP
jgi:hypothetical protein